MNAQCIEKKQPGNEESIGFIGFEELLYKSLDEMLATEYGMNSLIRLTEYVGSAAEVN